jgi:hypothetical protein
MRKVAPLIIGAALLAVPAAASAAIQQQAVVKLSPTAGALAPKGKNYVKVSAYLSTRDASSVRPQMKANPVGKVVMAFPAGSTINPKATPGCHMNQYSQVGLLKTKCAKSLIGIGWAFVNTGWSGAAARAQLTDIAGGPNSPGPCDVGDATQYTRAFAATGTPDCVPIGHIWNRVYAYQGAIISGKYNVNGVIFASDNAVAGIAFGGTTRTNALTVPLPAINGIGSGAGELPFGWVLSDFKLNITKPNYLKAGSCPGGHRWTVKSTISFSNFKADPVGPPPATQVINTTVPCRV